MVAHVIVVYLHYLGIMTLMAMLLAQYVTLQPNMTRLHMQRLATTDLLYAIAAGIVFITGVLRFVYFGKGMHFYLGNPLFYLKIGIFIVIALVSIYPTRQFASWRQAIAQDRLPDLDTQRLTRLRYVVRLELGLLIVIPLLAVLMARGIGLTS